MSESMSKSMVAKQYFDSIYRWVAPGIPVIISLGTAFFQFEIEKTSFGLLFSEAFIVFFKSHGLLILLISATIAAIFSFIHSCFCKPAIKSLRKELESEKEKNDLIGNRVRYLFEGYLHQLSRKLNFGNKQSNSERVTIYLHQSSAGRFVPFGRVSSNPKFATQRRSQYPDDEGCIAKGWQNGWHFDNNLGTGKKYNETNRNKYKMKTETLKNIRMRSKLYAVKRIDEAGQGEKLAVLVVESTVSNRFIRKELKAKLEHEEAFLSELIMKLRDFIAEFNYAKERGL